MQAEPSPFDSHPPPGQRIQWIQNVKGKEQAEPDRRLAWTLIPDPEKWQDEMTALMNRRVYDFIAAQQEMAAQQERDG